MCIAMRCYGKVLKGRLPGWSEHCQHFSLDLKDLVAKLVEPDLTKRLGCLKDGVDGVKDHVWFAPTSWPPLHCAMGEQSTLCSWPPLCLRGGVAS